MFRNWDNGLSQHLLSFFSAQERIKLALTCSAWKTQTNNEYYWKKQIELFWPAFFSKDKRIDKIAKGHHTYKKIFFVLTKCVSANTKKLIAQDIFDFKSGLALISELLPEYRQMFADTLTQNECDQYFNSKELYVHFCDAPSLEPILLTQFSSFVKNLTNSGWMLHACIGNISPVNKKRYLNLFTHDELLNLCNEIRVRGYSNFIFIRNYLLLSIVIMKIDSELSKFDNNHGNNNSFFDNFMNYFLNRPRKSNYFH